MKLKIASPVHLLRSPEPCWKCGLVQPVIALAAVNIVEDESGNDDPAIGNEPVILHDIAQMPKKILAHIHSTHPQYEKRTSKVAGADYYMNTCSCGAHFGDFYLHSEPGGAFFPDSEEQAGRIMVEELPFTGKFTFRCRYSMGVGDFIFAHARRG
jgi:hypothetical protein